MKNRIAGQTSGRIRNAMLTLLKEEQSLGKITIAALSDEAGISRRTFYRYYASKEEILTTYIANLINDYIAELRQSRLQKFEDLVSFFFNFWTQYADELSIIQKAGLFSLIVETSNKMIPVLYPTVEAPWQISSKNQRDIVYATRYGIGGFWNVLSQWLAVDRENISVSELSHILLNAMTSAQGR
ncbi:TetR/AcrR family transcriptional regulator [Leuconostoc gasicomitatum]|uniref:TetR/AcrR family transcriptional regulator n=1 Tax=Leuconostoc gasicomitatum TaxID=115778 RepID=A0A9Q3SWU7_9LACO|nr:TetR/AcrR family transcriptional regulator [Leuconostoc gasicomitatum]MBZ5962425.1 TetR/AcrR family transcriptional regulator [Leuconostoc gasicomitatum]MBZ5996791.1 TetR/AcrR family transcriptional regulator [Leuconostoc gasicomitatum]